MTLLTRLGVPNAVISLMDQGVVSATAFVTGVVVSRTCSQSEFGLYTLGATLVVFLIELQTALISSPYMVYSPRLHDAERARYAGGNLILQLSLGLFAAVVLGAIATTITAFGIGSEGLAPVLGVLAVVVTFTLLRDFLRRVAMAHMQMENALFLDISVTVLQLSALVVIAVLEAMSAPLAHAMIGAACATASVVWMARHRNTFTPSFASARHDLKQNWSFGKWVFASGLLWAFSIHTYPWILAASHGTAAAGIWGACLTTLSLIIVPSTGLQNWLGPRIAITYATGGAQRMRRFVIRAALGFGAVLAVMAALMIAFDEVLLVLIFGETYASNGAVLSVLAASVIARGPAFCFSRGLFAIERADIDFWVNLIPLAVLLIVGLWATSAYGALGAAVSLFLAHTLVSAVRGVALFAHLRSTDHRRCVRRD
jgi:O-antigen/teichoic acid export membrane protein